MSSSSGNFSKNTEYFPIRIPHDLRGKLDRVHALTGRPRAHFFIEGAEFIVNQILSSLPEVQSNDLPGPLSTE